MILENKRTVILLWVGSILAVIAEFSYERRLRFSLILIWLLPFITSAHFSLRKRKKEISTQLKKRTVD